MTRNDFQAAGAAVAGREHRRAGRRGQDAVAVRRGRGATVVVVADGCGSAAGSEVGAELGARLCAHAVGRRLDAGASPADPATWERAGDDVLAQLRVLALAIGDDPASIAADMMLFTLVGAAVTTELAVVFGLGDGVFAIDGAATELGPFPGNAPPYLGHRLLGGPATPLAAIALRPIGEVDSVVVATDGALPLVDDGRLTALADDPLVLGNPDGLRRRLAVLARDRIEVDWDAHRIDRDGGPLTDDAAVAILRRRR